MAGARVAMLASELLTHSPSRLSEILIELWRWTEEHDYESIAQLQGSMSQRAVAEPAIFERANHMKVLNAFRPQA
jgi:dihydroorotate dehydrogenase (fumarate)